MIKALNHILSQGICFSLCWTEILLVEGVFWMYHQITTNMIQVNPKTTQIIWHVYLMRMYSLIMKEFWCIQLKKDSIKIAIHVSYLTYIHMLSIGHDAVNLMGYCRNNACLALMYFVFITSDNEIFSYKTHNSLPVDGVWCIHGYFNLMLFHLCTLSFVSAWWLAAPSVYYSLFPK